MGKRKELFTLVGSPVQQNVEPDLLVPRQLECFSEIVLPDRAGCQPLCMCTLTDELNKIFVI